MLEEKVMQTINKYKMLEKGDKVVIGVSGGPDSMTLLNILNNLKEKWNINIFVAHINHGIREEADEETEYVKNFWEKIGVPFFVKRVKVEDEAKKLKIGTEEAGRNIRYQFFEEVAKKVGANKIATAHNANDNAETVLMNLLRGTSIAGLKGIEKIRDGKFIRPIIECERSEIEEYCKEKNLNPRYDKTNQENIYTSNKIRNQLIPYLQKEFNPNIIEGMNRLATLAKEEEDFLSKIVKKEYERIRISVRQDEMLNREKYLKQEEKRKAEEWKTKASVVLNLKEFNKLDKVIQSRLILYAIEKAYGKYGGIEKVHIDAILKLCQNNIGNKYIMPKKGIKVYVKKGKIFFLS